MMKGMSLAATVALTVALHAVPSLANGENFSRAGDRAHVAVTGDANGTVLAKMIKAKRYGKSGKSRSGTTTGGSIPNTGLTPTRAAPTPIPYRNRVGGKKQKVKSSGGSPTSLKNKRKRSNYKNIGNSATQKPKGTTATLSKKPGSLSNKGAKKAGQRKIFDDRHLQK